MKKFILPIALVFFAQFLLAKTDNPQPVVRTADSIKVLTDTKFLLDTIYDAQYCNALGVVRSTSSTFKHKQAGITATLFVNPALAAPGRTAFQVKVKCRFEYKTFTSATLRNDSAILSINYNPNAGAPYKAKDYFTIPNAIWAKVTTLKILVDPAMAISDSSFALYLQYGGEKIFTPNIAEKPSVLDFKASSNNGFLKLRWEGLPWAERYDVEWMYVDNYNGILGGEKPATEIAYNFRHNSTRVSTQQTELEIPLVFEQGYVLTRVRAVGLKGTNFDELEYGNWDVFEANSGTSIPTDVKHVYQISATLIHERDKMNWQYVGSFAGDDLHKEAVSYFDGSLRARQVVGASQTDLNLIVSETIYDYQGRPAIQTLPAAIKPETTTTSSSSASSSTGTGSVGGGLGSGVLGETYHGLNIWPSMPWLIYGDLLNIQSLLGIFNYKSSHPKIGYQKSLNQNSDGQPYSKIDFDTDRSRCNTSPEPFNTISGAGNYYSPNNADKTGANQFIPDAEGYPFTQISYLPDLTNRPQTIGKAGATLKLGGGHEQKMFYGVPSQNELDKMFGNDAGSASRYKKEMLLDENGQAHLSYKDIRGNVVATALAGDPPLAYAAVSHGEAINIQLNLIEQDNRVYEATQSLVSQNSLLLSKTSTVQFSYTLTAPSFSGNYCGGGSFCYDCIYDLEIIVRNECGDSVWGKTQTIGSLTPLNTCAAASVNLNQTVTLNAGNYFVGKRLTVNRNAIQQYVNDYKVQHPCVLPLTPYLPSAGLGGASDPCNSPCNTCPLSTIDTSRNYAVRQADGSILNMHLAVNRRAANDGNCTRYCNTGPPSPCATALEVLLSDVSPSGQYGEYMDTTLRHTATARDIVNPRAFSVSVLNDSNSLPIVNGNWRNPVFDYQNKDGSVAYIEIANDGTPDFRDVEILTRDGKRFVKPRFLNRVEDFIRYWQPQWAEALVAYHPEYPYYNWCINHQDSYSYDSLAQQTNTYLQATSEHLTNRETNDPFFRAEPSAVSTLTNSLDNFLPLTGFGFLKMEEAVYLAVNCNNVNLSATQVYDSVHGKALYTRYTVADKEWTFYRDFYLLKKHKAHDIARRNWITARGFFLNNQIGNDSRDAVPNVLYADKTKRFNDVEDGLEHLPVEIDSITEASISEWRNAAAAQMRTQCGGSIAGYDLTSFLNALVLEKKLKQSLNLPSVTPLAFSKPMTRLFSDSMALAYRWNSAVTANSLQYKVSTTRGEQCVINLNKSAAYDWDSIIQLDCFSVIDAHSFTLRGRTKEDSVFQITGNSSCMDFMMTTTTRVCVKQASADEMAVLMKYIFQANRFRNTNLLLRDARTYHSPIGEALREQTARADRWTWKFISLSESDRVLTADLAVRVLGLPASGTFSGTDSRTVNCPFVLRVLTAGFSFNDVAEIIDISRVTTTTTCNVSDFILTARKSNGAIFKIQGTSCYTLYKCCQSGNQSSHTGVCCLPIVPKMNFERTCGQDAHDVAETNRLRDEINRAEMAADSFEQTLVQHCLRAAENFSANYTDAIYQITLSYFDRAGNLIKTISPKGVQLLTDAQLNSVRNYRRSGGTPTLPSHTMATTYRYNSFNQLVQKNSPDEGITRFCYDQNGRTIMSQDAVQVSANACTFNLYDANDRVYESGRRNFSGTLPSFQLYQDFKNETEHLTGSAKAEITRTVYDVLPTVATSYFSSTKKNLRNRVASITSEEVNGTMAHAIYFDYDVAGNTRNMVQDLRQVKSLAPSAFSTIGSNIKKISYDYNLVSGKVKRVWYQKNQSDQFIHWYQYDDDGKLLKVQTGTNPNEMETLRELDAQYFYYPHGLLARVELGAEKIQGIDYAYTINGMMKGINSGNANVLNDIGNDGGSGAAHGHFMADVFGESLNYFNEDYKSISSTAAEFSTTTSGDLATGFSKPLYNGFIQNTISTLNVGGILSNEKMAARGFKYDQAGRLNEMKMIFASNTSNSIGGTFSDDYKMNLSYDANGNIATLLRRGKGADMDNLTYNYPTNNRLSYIDDAVGGVVGNDLHDQADGNYRYDNCGRLTRDLNGQLDLLQWNNKNKLKQVQKIAGETIQYGYDAFGNRAWRKNSSGVEFYVNDAQGNTLASYKVNGSELRCENINIYGSARIGSYNLNEIVQTETAVRDSFLRGLKRYEIVNHSGDVQAVVSDKRVRTSSVSSADIISATDYYPFGMVMPNRSFGTRTYRYGFQGMECDSAVAGDGNSYTTEFRQYDPRVCRWMSVDPMENKYPDMSPYVAFMNNPISVGDANGADPLTAQQFSNRLMEIATRDMRLMEGMSMDEMLTHIARELMEDGTLQILEMPAGAIESSEEQVRTFTSVGEVSEYLQSNATSTVEFVHEALDSYFGLQLALRATGLRDAARRAAYMPRRGRAGTAARARYERYAAARLRAGQQAARAERAAFRASTRGRIMRGVGAALAVHSFLSTAWDVYQIYVAWEGGAYGTAVDRSIGLGLDVGAGALMAAGYFYSAGAVMVVAEVGGWGSMSMSHAGDTYDAFFKAGLSVQQADFLIHMVSEIDRIRREHIDEDVAPSRMTTGGGSTGRRGRH